MRSALSFLGGLLVGGGVGYVVAEHYLQNKMMVSAQEQIELHKRAISTAAEVAEKRVKNVFEEDEGRPDVDLSDHPTLPLEDAPEPVKIQGDLFQPKSPDGEGFSPETENPYHIAVSAKETPVEQFVDGGINDYGMSYIEEEDYQEDDGRAKEQIVILMDEHNPIFLQDGAEIRDWDERVGDSILVDMFRFCPPGKPQILYVRNHKTDVDYEVVREQP